MKLTQFKNLYQPYLKTFLQNLNHNQNINLLIKRIDLLIKHDHTQLGTVIHKSLIIDLARHLIEHYLDYNTGVQLNFWSDIKHLMSEHGGLHHSSPRYDTLKQLAVQFIAECTYERYKITEFYLNLDTITKTIA